MRALQESLEQAVTELSAIFLENLVSKKLREQGITAPRGLSEKVAKHLLSGIAEPLSHKSRKYSGNIKLAFAEADADEIILSRASTTGRLKTDAISLGP